MQFLILSYKHSNRTILLLHALTLCFHHHRHVQFLPTKDYATFMDALGALLADKALAQQKPQSAAFACAGPVVKGRCEMTNLGWTVDAAEVEKVYDIKCVVIDEG